MPYKISKIPNSHLYKVVNTEDGKIHAYHTTEDKAKKQVRLLPA